jgi:hypothetical protein
MKKLLIVFFLFLLSFTLKAQYPINQFIGADSTLVTSRGGLKGRLVNTSFFDTTAANFQQIKQYAGSQIYTTSNNSFWVRDSTAQRWIKQINVNDIVNIIGCNVLLNGGIVTYSGTGLVFDVSPARYLINCGGFYNSPQTQVTLAAADPINPRVDVVAADINGNIVVLTGTPSANPIKPQIDALTQLELTHIDVAAGSTSPGGVTTYIIYDENTEWAGTSNGVTANFNNNVNPFHLTKAVSLSSFSVDLSKMAFSSNGVDINLASYSALKFYIRTELTQIGVGNGQIIINWIYNGASISNGVVISNGNYGFTSFSDGIYQVISIPISDFAINQQTANGLVFQFNEPNFSSCNIDYVQLQGGIQSGNSSYVTNVYRKSATDSVFKVINNVAVFAFKDSTGGAIPTLQQVLSAGSTLVGGNNITNGGSFVIEGGNNYIIGTSGDSRLGIDSSTLTTWLGDLAGSGNNNYIALYSKAGNPGNQSVDMNADSIIFRSKNNGEGVYKIMDLPATVSNTTLNKIMTLNTGTKRIGIAEWPSTSNIYTANGTLTGNRFLDLGTTNTLSFGKGANTNFHLFNNGNVWLGNGTPSDGGFRLDVQGTTRLAGAVTTTAGLTAGTAGASQSHTFNIGSSSFQTLRVVNSASATILSVTGAGSIIMGNANTANVIISNRLNASGTAVVSDDASTSTSSAALEVTSTTRGFLPPRMTATQASAIGSPAEGLLVYVTDTNGTFTSKGWWGFNGSIWEKLNN